MAFDAIAANLFHIYISTGMTTGAEPLPIWVKVEGLQTITPQPQERTADATTVDNAGWTQEVKVSGGMNYQIAGLSMRDEETQEKAPGQAALEVHAKANGSANVGLFAIKDPDESECLQFRARVSDFVGFGGGPDALAPFSATLGCKSAPEVKTATEIGLPA